ENVYQRLIDSNPEKKAELENVKNDIEAITNRLIGIKEKSKDQQVQWKTATDKLKKIADDCYELYAYFDKLKEAKRKAKTKSQDTDPSYDSSTMWKLYSDLSSLSGLLDDVRPVLFNKPRMLLRGEAGIGKTHLLCDYAKERIEAHKPTFVFLGHELSGARTSDPVEAIAKVLGYRNTPDFIKDLQSLCSSSDERVCLIIDAVNEADQIKWTQLTQLHRIKGLSLIISLRNGYDYLVKDRSKYTIIEHSGFSEIEWEAIPLFFGHYKLKLPEIPIIDPEFKNPLFLTIFCKAYSKNGKTPRGKGATHVFEHYIATQSKKIIQELQIKDSNGVIVPDKYLWNVVIKGVGVWMGKNGKNRILRPKLLEIIKQDPKLAPSASKLIQLMERDGLILKYPHYSKSYRRTGYNYQFTYHRFSDHLIVRSILTENGIHGPDASTKAKTFLSENGFFKRIVESYNEGLVEALAIQIPERCGGDELAWLIPRRYRDHYTVKRAFIEGLKWRDVVTKGEGDQLKYINEKQVTKYLNEYMLGEEEDEHRVINCMLDVSAIPSHPFNADRFHKFMCKFTLPKRDSWWQEFLVNGSSQGGPVDRLHSWSLSDLTRQASPESTKLAAVALTWTLASTNRVIRDTSTRSVIALLSHQQAILYGLMSEYFWNNNDPYITQRLFATIYGCLSINPNDKHNFKKIASFIYKNHFKNSSRRPDALQDDYAKAIIELYLRTYRNDIWVRHKRINPPYAYRFPKRIPTVDGLKKKYRGEDRDYYSIWGSLMYGDAAIADFGNYTLGHALRKFSNTPNGVKPKVTEKDKYNRFIESLTRRQKKLFEAYNSLHHTKFISSILSTLEEEPKKSPHRLEITLQDEDGADDALVKFEKSLGVFKKHKYALYKPFITGEKSFPTHRSHEFDLNIARRWIFTRVISLGWNPAQHSNFDKYTARDGHNRMEEVRTERIGKKYQWIGLYEFAALLGSNYRLLEDTFSSNPKYTQYEGTYQIGIRDFDPTIDPRWLAKMQRKGATSNGWWVPSYTAWDRPNWRHSTEDIPRPKELVETKKDKITYLNLQCWVTWKGQSNPPEDKDSYNYPELWVHVNAYIVKKKDLQTVVEWCEEKEFWNGLLPEPNQESNGVFLKEFDGSNAYMQAFYPYYERSDWMPKTTDRPFDLLTPIEAYTSSSFTGDGTIKNNFDVYMPNYYLRKNLQLLPTEEIGSYKSSDERIKMFDPSADEEPGRETLLVNKDEFLEEIEKQGLTIFWTVLGEKMYIQSHDQEEYRGQRLEIHGFCYYDESGNLVENIRFKNEWKDEDS
ncbi:MAG: hypothetical protein QG640_615, partial [Patescibacteria group bacterium]|nr:hypothetical protein [Patescibacteria group bacterium]